MEFFGGLGYHCPNFLNPADFLLDIILKDGDEGGSDSDPSLTSMKDFSKLEHSSLLEFERPSVNNRECYVLLDTETLPSYSPAELQDFYQQGEEFKQLSRTLEEMTKNSLQLSYINSFEPVKLLPSVSKFSQTFILLKRTWMCYVRDSNVIYVRTLVALLIALLVGVVFFQQPDDSSSDGNIINSILFLMCVFSLFCIPSISKFIEERATFSREHASGLYHTFPYFISSFLCELPILIFTVLAYSLIAYWMVGYATGFGHFMFFLVVVFLVIQTGYGICQVLASVCKSVNIALAVYLFFLVYSLLLGGFIIHKASLPSAFQWVVYTSYFFYGFAALLVNQYEDKSYGSQVLASLNLTDVNKYYCCGFLLFLWVAAKIIEYLCLRFLNKEKR